jgi:hypothetical protein
VWIVMKMYSATFETPMAEVVNLRRARKQAERRRNDEAANAARLAHGEPKRLRKLEAARQEKAGRDLDLHRIEPGDRR